MRIYQTFIILFMMINLFSQNKNRLILYKYEHDGILYSKDSISKFSKNPDTIEVRQSPFKVLNLSSDLKLVSFGFNKVYIVSKNERFNLGLLEINSLNENGESVILTYSPFHAEIVNNDILVMYNHSDLGSYTFKIIKSRTFDDIFISNRFFNYDEYDENFKFYDKSDNQIIFNHFVYEKLKKI